MYQMYGNQDGMNPFNGQDEDDNNQVSDYNDNAYGSPFQSNVLFFLSFFLISLFSMHISNANAFADNIALYLIKKHKQKLAKRENVKQLLTKCRFKQ